MLRRLPLLGSTLDEARQVDDWQLEWEVQGGQHDRHPDVPSEHADHESTCTSCLQLCRNSCLVGSVVVGVHEESVCDEAEGWDEEEEDQEENQVGSKGEDHVEEAQHCHEHEEESCISQQQVIDVRGALYHEPNAALKCLASNPVSLISVADPPTGVPA